MIKKISIIIVLIIIVVGLFAIYNKLQNQPSTAMNTETQTQEQTPIQEETVGMANPASVHCSEVGGTLSIKTDGSGAQYGLCYFEENRACEEWALMRGECPVGGRKTTGYDTEAQRYCAWIGGTTNAELGATCSKGERVCDAEQLFRGECSL